MSGALGAWCVGMQVHAWALAGRGQDPPLPNRDTFLAEVRKRLKSDDRLQGQYTYTERQVRVDFDDKARQEKRTARTFEVYPSLEGSPSYRRLVTVNGVPVPPKALEEADRKHRERLQAWVRDRARETASDRAKREQKQRADQQTEERVIDDIVRVFDIRLVGREAIRGRPAIVMTFVPGAIVTLVCHAVVLVHDVASGTLEPASRICATSTHAVRVELQSIDTISIGWGLLARVQKGTTLSFERQKVNGEVWLPARSAAHPKARIALFKRFDAEIVSDYGDYRKFTVDTAISFAPAK